MYFDEVTSFLLEDETDIINKAARISQAFKAARTRKENNIIGKIDNDEAAERISNDPKIYNKIVKNYDYLNSVKNKEGVKDIIKIGIQKDQASDPKEERIARRDIRKRIFGTYNKSNIQQELYNKVFKKTLGTKSKNVDFTSGINDPGEKVDLNLTKLAKNPEMIKEMNRKSIKEVANDAFKKAFRINSKGGLSIDLMSEDKYLIEFPKGAFYANDGGNSNSADYLYKDGNTFHFVEAKLGRTNRSMMSEVSSFIKSLVNLTKFSNEKITIGKPIILKENSVDDLNKNNIFVTLFGGIQKRIRHLTTRKDINNYILLNKNKNPEEMKKVQEALDKRNLPECRKIIGDFEYNKMSEKEKEKFYNFGSGVKKTNVANTLGGIKEKFIYSSLNEMKNDLKSKGARIIESPATPKEVRYIVNDLNKLLGNNVFMTKL